MTAYDDRVDAIVGAADDKYDVSVVERPCYFYDIPGYPFRVWEGQGSMFASGFRWRGTIDASGTDHHQVPGFDDGRDGSSAELSFTIPYLPEDAYTEIRANRDLIKGCEITRYMVLFGKGEGLRPAQTPIDFDAVVTIQSIKFMASVELDEAGVMVRRFPVTFVCKNGNSGQSQAPRGTYSPASQRRRALELYGIAVDKGCDFIPPLADMTLQKP